ncbi:alkaline phosphatase [Bacteroidia bacterium]|nr:alkaline phosphatase [Bacteroidia bacterium]
MVVSIVVDQLRSDYLHYFSPTFGERGFKRLMNEGLVYYSVDFGYPHRSEAASIASIYTGAYPSENGITGDTKYDFATNRVVSIVADDNYLGNYTSDRVSPKALMASTVGDELTLATQGKSQVIAIAPNAAEAIISGGRNATYALWLDDYNGQWATSTYYKDIPNCIDRYNFTQAPANVPEKIWQQSLSYYNGFPYTKQTYPFLHKFSKSPQADYRRFKQSALINTEITDLAMYVIEQEPARTIETPNFLAITYYAGNYKEGKESEEYSYEVQDTYYRLDKELGRLFDCLERRVGLAQVLIILTSTGYYDALPSSFANAGANEFYPERCKALLNMYLIAMYGQGNWVAAYHDRQIYLDKKLAESKDIHWKELVKNASDFVAQFSGVQSCWSREDIPNANGVNKKISGDLFLELQSGWVEMDAQNKTKDYSRNNAILSPLFIWSNHLKHEQVSRPIKATEIAPTISSILRIKSPDASKEIPLYEIFK